MGRVFRFQTRSSDLKQEMKLFAAILFAATTAQRDREREVEVSNDDSYDSYNAGFGGDDAYGGSYDAFADAFGDAGNYGDYGYDNADDATAAPVAVEAGRPVEVVQEDDGKTVFIDGLALPASDPEDGSFNQNCWVARGTSSTAWFTAGGGNGWAQCNGGEHQACEIKVTRNSKNEITQIVSKCANQQSCVDNMIHMHSNNAAHNILQVQPVPCSVRVRKKMILFAFSVSSHAAMILQWHLVPKLNCRMPVVLVRVALQVTQCRLLDWISIFWQQLMLVLTKKFTTELTLLLQTRTSST